MTPREQILARKAVHTELTEIIECAITDRDMLIAWGETVGTVEEHIAGWILRSGYTK